MNLREHRHVSGVISKHWKNGFGTKPEATYSDVKKSYALSILHDIVKSSGRDAASLSVNGIDEVCHMVHFAALWAESNKANFRLTHRIAAAFVLSECGDGFGDDLRLPFDAFTIEMPQPLVSFIGKDGKPEPVVAIGVKRFLGPEQTTEVDLCQNDLTGPEFIESLRAHKPVMDARPWFQVSAHGDGDICVFKNIHFPSNDADLNVDCVFGDNELHGMDIHALSLCTRIAVHTCLYLNSLRTEVDSDIGVPSSGEIEKSFDGSYVLGRHIKLFPQVIEAAKAYCANPDKSIVPLQCRFVVRGHWRNQVVGPGRSGRRRTWIEPHWKGPEGAVQAVARTYEVSERGEA